jgi:ferric-dicitrate binding protein FerR (iron transport regulator)
MTSRDFTIEELLQHPVFRQWVIERDASAAAYWQEWLQEHPHRATDLARAREMLLLIGGPSHEPSAADAAETWERVLQSINRGSGRLVQMPGHRMRRWWSYAAVLTGILVMTYAIYFFSRKDTLHYATAMGEIRTVELPDHSQVRLNVNSTLRYSEKWDNGGPREVWLDGEAFFTVQHQQHNRRFIVHTADVDIQVVGTEFNVNTRWVKTQVVLSTGVVKLMLNSKDAPGGAVKQAPITMKPGDMVTYSSATQELSNKKVDPAAYASWRTGVLSFDETPVAEVIRSLQDNLGVVIQLEDERLGGQTYTGSIPMNDINVFFKTLERSFNVHTRKTGANTYTIVNQEDK